MAYPHLPGVTLNLADLGLKIAPPPAGPRVTLLGVCSNTGVPLGEPLVVTNIGKAINSFWASGGGGLYPAFPSELAIAVEECSSAGAENIEVVCLAHVEGSDYDAWINPISGYYQEQRWTALSGAYETLMQSTVDVVHPINAWVDATGANFGKQLANFCHQKSKELDNTCVGVAAMMTPIEWAQAYNGWGGMDAIEQGAGDGTPLSGEARDIRLSTTPQADVLFGSPSIALINEWVKYATQDGGPIIEGTATAIPGWFNGFLDGAEDAAGTFYPQDDTNDATDVNANYWLQWQALDSDGTLAVDQKGNKVDAGRRLCVFGVPVVTNTTQRSQLAGGVGASITNTVHNTNGAAAYAGRITTLVPQSAPTNKKISNLAATRPLSPAQANLLTARRITTMHTRATGFVVTSAITGAHNVSKYVRSDFVRLTTIRIVDSVVNLVRAVSDRYIGEPNTASARNALHNDVEKYLKQMRVANAVRGWTMFISATPDQQVLGEAVIDLTIVPAFELVKIECNVALSKGVA